MVGVPELVAFAGADVSDARIATRTRRSSPYPRGSAGIKQQPGGRADAPIAGACALPTDTPAPLLRTRHFARLAGAPLELRSPVRRFVSSRTPTL